MNVARGTTTRTLIATLLLVIVVSALHAGPIVTVTMTDGTTEKLELRGYEQGAFTFRRLDGKKDLLIRDQAIRDIDYGARSELIAPPPPPVKHNTEAFWAAVDRRQFFNVFWRCVLTVGSKTGKAPVVAFEKELLAKLYSGKASKQEQRDVRLALVATALSMGERAKATELMKAIDRDYPGDAVVKSLKDRLQKMRRQAPGRRGTPRLPKRKNNDKTP